MSTSLICPECGGIIGATEATDEGKPCICFQTGKSAGPAMDVPASKPKVCCQCGTDLTGKERLRDSRGYWCKDCHRSDKKASEPQGVRCPDCGRVVLPGAIVEWDNRKICESCRNDLRNVSKVKKYKQISDKNFHREERKMVMWLVVAAGVLLTIIILSQLHIIPRFF
jgi:hypothetical protein